MKYQVASEMFKTKKAIKDRCKSILNSHKRGEVITGKDQIFLRDLIKGHPGYDVKDGGVGIMTFYVDRVNGPNYSLNCFHLRRFDGTTTDFSYIQCVDGARSDKKIVMTACRSAIAKDIQRFRNESVVYGVSTCEITGEVLTTTNSHVDHKDPTFQQIFNDWISNKNVKELLEKINPQDEDNNVSTYFADKSTAEDFRAYHNSLATLRVITKQANLRRKKK